MAEQTRNTKFASRPEIRPVTSTTAHLSSNLKSNPTSLSPETHNIRKDYQRDLSPNPVLNPGKPPPPFPRSTIRTLLQKAETSELDPPNRSKRASSLRFGAERDGWVVQYDQPHTPSPSLLLPSYLTYLPRLLRGVARWLKSSCLSGWVNPTMWLCMLGFPLWGMEVLVGWSPTLSTAGLERYRQAREQARG